MSLIVILPILGIAVIDSLNPSLFLGQFLLLATKRPVPRTLAYIAGLLLVNFLGGVLILAGVRTLITQTASSIPTDSGFLLQGGLGLLLLWFGFTFKGSAQQDGQNREVKSLGLGYAFLFGMIVMVNELTTAFPYFIAIERISSADPGMLGSLLLLAMYNFVFALPLFAFLYAFMRLQNRFLAQVERINAWMRVWMPRIIKYSSIAFGGLLLLNAAAHFLLGKAIF
jgi:cytochrome c biogenesis protein CcdA